MSKIKKRWVVIFLIVLFNLNLIGCEMMNDSYDCPLKGSASCESLHDMDKRISNGTYYIEGISKATTENTNNTIAELPNNFFNRKIWLAPQTDSAGNQHEARYVLCAGCE